MNLIETDEKESALQFALSYNRETMSSSVKRTNRTATTVAANAFQHGRFTDVI
jgi:hypothetical protein